MTFGILVNLSVPYNIQIENTFTCMTDLSTVNMRTKRDDKYER